MRTKLLALLGIALCIVLLTTPTLAAITHVGTDAQQQSSTRVSSVAVTAGQAPTNGNIVLVHFTLTFTTGITTTGPAGYTCSSGNEGAAESNAECYHIAGAGETAALGTFSFSTASGYCISTAEFSGENVTQPVASTAFANYNGSAGFVAVSYPAPSAASAFVVGYAFNSGSSATLSITGYTVDRNINSAGSTCPTVSTYHGPSINSSGSYSAAYSGGGVGTGASAIELTDAIGSGADGSFMGIWLRSRFERLIERGY